MAPHLFPALPEGFETTRATLHAYAKAVGAVPRAHGIAHPQWWHVALKVRPEGLVTDPIPLPDGGALGLRMDLRRHEITVRSADGDETVFDMREGSTGTEMGSRIIDLAAARGLEGGYDRARFANDEPRSYDPDAASSYFDAFVAAHSVFERHRVTLGQRVGPIQVWPHGFDLAFEWFGTRTAISGGAEAPAQLNLGFYPGRDPYFYSNPWPFDESLLDTPLPAGSAWHTEGWQGSMLPYEAVAGDPEPAARLAGFARAVFEAAAPTLDAP